MKHIVQIELTNYCNRKCAYCGQTNMTRPKGYMTGVTFDRCISILTYLNQKTVGLNHYGESLMHVDFPLFLSRMNGAGINPWLYTNGDFLNRPVINLLASYRLEYLVISGHLDKMKRIELAQQCIDAGITAYWQDDITEANTIDLAGQVNPKNAPALPDPARQCAFIREEKAIVLWNGDLVPCCCDYDGALIFGNIHDIDAVNLVPQVGGLCSSCSGHPSNIIL